MKDTKLLETLSNDYSLLLESGELVDVQIQAGEDSDPKNFYKAHSIVLWSRSIYFRSALSEVLENNANIPISIKISQINHKLFGILLKYIYDGTIDLENIEFQDILYLMLGANELKLLNLVDYLQEYLSRNKNILKDHFFFINRICKEKFKKLASLCDIILIQETFAILNSPEILSISQEELLHFYANLPTTCNSFSEIILWEKLIDWAIEQLKKEKTSHLEIENNSLLRNSPPDTIITSPFDNSKLTDEDQFILKKLIEPFISFINFKIISKNEFLQKVRPWKNILNDNFYIQLLEYHTFNNIQQQIPQHSQLNIPSSHPHNSFKEPPKIDYYQEPLSSSQLLTQLAQLSELQQLPQLPQLPAINSSHKSFVPKSITSNFSSPPEIEELDNNSTIINADHFKQINKWINKVYGRKQDAYYDFNILVRGSVNGFTPEVFHEYCDNKGATISLLKVKGENKVVGGYNPKSWITPEEDKHKYTVTKLSFIFSIDLDNNENSIFSKVEIYQFAVLNKGDIGPSFGRFNDLVVCGKNFRHCRCKKAAYETQIREDNKFGIEELEVYSVIKSII
ncbi:7868_t:CDS:2 [Diversispora eburnea]|uniref:7868_t:CDS:1 n=1 Tax=Diversispora eburnea TaxID=1213867 RepID=A0A9N9FMC9_9GLOM|nr:7868_t:CDS:2 [Diversispora eburnea]